MEPQNEMRDTMQAMVTMSTKNQTIKAEPFSGKQEDFPKWQMKQKQYLIMVIMGHVLEKSFLMKLSSSETLKLDENIPEHKQTAKCWRQDAKYLQRKKVKM